VVGPDIRSIEGNGQRVKGNPPCRLTKRVNIMIPFKSERLIISKSVIFGYLSQLKCIDASKFWKFRSG